jgi:hypothetical protein
MPMKVRSTCATLFLVACGKAGADQAVHQATGPAQPVAGVSSLICIDTISEKHALECSGQTARRVGDTLFVRLRTGHDTTFVDTKGEAPGGFRYAGRIAGGAFHLIESYGHESYPQWIVASDQSGHRIVAPELPVFSPDSARFATGGSAWDNCSESNGVNLEVWRMTDTMPVVEWRVVTQGCKDRNRGWGATELHWRSPDTLEFVRNEFVRRDTSSIVWGSPERRRQAMRAVRDQGGWRIIDKR